MVLPTQPCLPARLWLLPCLPRGCWCRPLAAETASGSPQPLKALPGTAAPLLRALHAALGSKDFLVNGGRIGFACRHAYPASLVAGVNEQVRQQGAVRAR